MLRTLSHFLGSHILVLLYDALLVFVDRETPNDARLAVLATREPVDIYRVRSVSLQNAVLGKVSVVLLGVLDELIPWRYLPLCEIRFGPRHAEKAELICRDIRARLGFGQHVVWDARDLLRKFRPRPEGF